MKRIMIPLVLTLAICVRIITLINGNRVDTADNTIDFPGIFPQVHSQLEAGEERKIHVFQIRESDISSVNSIDDVVTLMTAVENNRMLGYRVRPPQNRKLFDQIGLKAGDLIVSANGIKINTPNKVLEAAQELKSATEADLEIIRNGRPHSIHIVMIPDE